MFYLGFWGSDKSLCDGGGVHTAKNIKLPNALLKVWRLRIKILMMIMIIISSRSVIGVKLQNEKIPFHQINQEKGFYEDSYVGNSVILGLCRQCQRLMFRLCVLLCNPFQLHTK